MSRRWQRPITFGVLAVYLMLFPWLVVRAVAGSPRYRACIAAMDRVAVGMPWAEADRTIDEAVAEGWARVDDDTNTPQFFLAAPRGTLEVTCWRRGDGTVSSAGNTVGRVWKPVGSLIRAFTDASQPDATLPPFVTLPAFVPADYIQFEIEYRDALVHSARSRACITEVYFQEPGWENSGCRRRGSGESLP